VYVSVKTLREDITLKRFHYLSIFICCSSSHWNTIKHIDNRTTIEQLSIYCKQLSFLNNHFLDSLSSSYSSNSFIYLLSSFLHVFSTFVTITPSLYNILKCIRLSFARPLVLSVACSYCVFLNVLIPFSMLNFSLSHNIFPSSWTLNCPSHS